MRYKISKLPALQLESIIPNSNDAFSIVNDRISAVNECILQVADGLCHNASFKQCKAKPFRCPELATLRNKKNFWWNLWVTNGRPRHGHIIEIWKSCKKAYRKFYRRRCSTDTNVRFNKINVMFAKGRIIWNLLKPKRKSSSFNIDINVLAQHFENIMTDDWLLNSEQAEINSDVVDKYRCHRDMKMECGISQTAIANNIRRLKRNCAPVIDGVTTKHMLYALSDTFCTELMNLYSTMFKLNVIPDVLKIGVIVPILKKSTLSGTVCENFRPITLSSVHAKLVEMLILSNTNTNICGNQYEYQAGKGTEFCCAFLNDCVAYFNEGDSPVYTCTLDAVKCFDNIWHEGLLYKLWISCTGVCCTIGINL